MIPHLAGFWRRSENAQKTVKDRSWHIKEYCRGYFVDYDTFMLSLAILLALFAAFSLCVFYHMRNSDQVLLYYTKKSVSMASDILSTPKYLLYLLTVPILSGILYYALTNPVEFSLSELLCAVFLAFNMVVSLSMEHSDLSCICLPLNKSSLERMLNAFACLGFFSLTFSGVHILYTLLEWKTLTLSKNALTPRFQKPLFWAAFITMLSFWAPVVIACYPGAVHSDTISALNGYYGFTRMDVSFPILITIFYGEILRFGSKLVSDSFGAFLCVLFGDLINAAIMSKVAVEVRRYTKSFWWYLVTVLFYAVCPVWRKASVFVLKDVIHTGCFLLFCMQFFACLVEKRSTWKDVIWMGICMFLVSFTRRATYWLSVICIVMLIVSRWKDYRIKYTLCLALMMGLFTFCNSVLYPALNFKPEREVENYSLPFQQMSLYVRTHKKEITKEEKAIINETLDFDKMLSDYTPMISDPVKRLFHAQGKDHSEFFQLYYSYMRKHPMTFVKSFFMGSFEHSNPWYDGERNANVYITTSKNFFNAEFRDDKARWDMNQRLKEWLDIPVLRLTIGTGLYSWILLAMVGYASFKRSMWGFLASFPSFVLWIGLFMSHVNGLIRYGYPLIAATPLVCAFTVYGVAASRKASAAASPAPPPHEKEEEKHELRWLSTFRDPNDEEGSVEDI